MFAVLPIFLFLYFSWGVYKWSFFNLQGLSRKFLLSAFVLKIIAGLALTYLYTYYYDIREEADTFRYFDDSYHLHRVFFDSPVKYFRILLGIDEGKDLLPYLDAMNNWFPQERNTFYNDNRTVIRINALLRWISFGNYYVHLLFFSFASFYGITFIYKAFHRYFSGKKIWLGLIIFFLPSLVFWSSAVLKEGPLLFFFGITLNVLNKIFTKRAYWQHYLLLCFCFLCLFHIKFYVGLTLVPAITGYLWILYKKGPHPIIKMITNFGVYFLAAVLKHEHSFRWSFFSVLKWKRSAFLGLAEKVKAKSLIETGQLEDTPISFLKYFMLGFFNAVSRPFPWEIYSIVILPNAIENIIVFAFISFCIWYGQIKNFDKIGYFFIMFAFGLLTIIGMVTPIIGSLVRYKIPAIPFLLMFFLLFLNKEKSKKTLLLFNKKKT